MNSAEKKADPGAWYVDEQVRVIGYHHYQPGKTVRTFDYFRNHKNMYYVSGLSLDPKVLAEVERLYGDVEITITPKRGLLIGSTAIAQIPGSNAFVRAHSRVNTGKMELNWWNPAEPENIIEMRVGSDLGKGSKKFGREVATARVLKVLRIIDNCIDVCGLSGYEIMSKLKSFTEAGCVFDERNLIEIVDKYELTPNERSLLRLPKHENQDAQCLT